MKEQVLQKFSAWWESTKPQRLLREHLTHYALPYITALDWAHNLCTNEVNDAHRTIAHRALEREGVKEVTSEEVERWARELIPELREVLAGLGLQEVIPHELYEPKLEEGRFALDVRAANALEQRGAVALAQVIRAESLKRTTSYLESLPVASPFGRTVATQSLWWLFDNDKLEQEGLPPFALAIFVARALIQRKRHKDPIPTPTKEEPAPKETEAKDQILSTAALPVEKVSTLHIEVAKIYSATYKPEEVKLSDDFSQVLRNGEVIASVPSLPKQELALLQRGLHQVARTGGATRADGRSTQ